MKNAGIIGYGRFGKVLADLLSKKYKVRVYDTQEVAKDEGVKICSLEEVLECILVFIAVPIRSFEEVIKEHVVSPHKFLTIKNQNAEKPHDFNKWSKDGNANRENSIEIFKNWKTNL